MTQSATNPVKPDLLDPFVDPVQLVDADVAADVAADAADDVAADVAADVGDNVGHDVMMTSSLTRVRPDPTDPDIDPTQSTTRPGQRSTTQSAQRSTTRPDPVNINPAACCTRFHVLPHTPNLLVAREGACEGIFGRF